MINCVARRRQCCGVSGRQQHLINVRQSWEDLRMTCLSFLLYVWVVGPLVYILSRSAEIILDDIQDDPGFFFGTVYYFALPYPTSTVYSYVLRVRL
jgi:hypothetical protein